MTNKFTTALPKRKNAPATENISRMKDYYNLVVAPELMKKWKITNVNAIPKISKIVVHNILGKHFKDKNLLKITETDLTLLTGQTPIKVDARKSLAAWSIRTGMQLGYKVTLRGNKMYQFMDRMLNLALPAYRNFTGLTSKQFDGRGGITIGFPNYNVFKEITFRTQELGLGVNIATSTANNEMAQDLLELMGFPFKNPRDINNAGLYFKQFAAA